MGDLIIIRSRSMSTVEPPREQRMDEQSGGKPTPLIAQHLVSRFCNTLLEPSLPRSTGLGPVCSPPFSPGH